MSRLAPGLKLAVSLGLVAAIAIRADWGRTAEVLAQASFPLLGLVLGVMVSGILLSAYRWGLLLRSLGVPHRFAELQRYYFIGMFLNNFLPTSVGGDAYRAYRTGSGGESAASVSAVLAERLTGVTAMIALAWVFALLDHHRSGSPFSGDLVRYGGTVLLVGAALAALALLLLERSAGPGARGGTGWLRTVGERILALRRRPALLLPVILLSLLFHLFMAWGVSLLFLALGVEASFPRVFVIMALSQLIGLVPVSLNGLGLTDGALIYTASLYDIPYEAGLGAALVTRLFMMLISLHGGLLYLRESLKVPPAAT